MELGGARVVSISREGKAEGMIMLNLTFLDPQTGENLWCCPQCGELIRLSSRLAACKAELAGGCQGCRAKRTFQDNPELIGFYLDFWARTDTWPQSHCWLEALPASGIAMVNSGYPATETRATESSIATDGPKRAA
jgi:hypothetical protein